MEQVQMLNNNVNYPKSLAVWPEENKVVNGVFKPRNNSPDYCHSNGVNGAPYTNGYHDEDPGTTLPQVPMLLEFESNGCNSMPQCCRSVDLAEPMVVGLPDPVRQATEVKENILSSGREILASWSAATSRSLSLTESPLASPEREDAPGSHGNGGEHPLAAPGSYCERGEHTLVLNADNLSAAFSKAAAKNGQSLNVNNNNVRFNLDEEGESLRSSDSSASSSGKSSRDYTVEEVSGSVGKPEKRMPRRSSLRKFLDMLGISQDEEVVEEKWLEVSVLPPGDGSVKLQPAAECRVESGVGCRRMVEDDTFVHVNSWFGHSQAASSCSRTERIYLHKYRSEEPAPNNMDITTGHVVLAYMEDHLHNKDRLAQEWEGLCSYEADPCETTSAQDPGNQRKNRYSDVLPYDHSRVVLTSASNVNQSDYINASSITDHDPRNPAYIATQGPLPHTVADFWQMVWEQGSVVIVNLTKLTEDVQAKCHRYWPEEGSELYHTFEIHLVSEHIWCEDYVVRSFYLKNLQTGETRTVSQFHFLTWPDLGIPGSCKPLLEFRRKVNKSYKGRSCPVVVHCSDGAGRSGTYCLIDMVLNRLSKGAKELDIAATLEHIRDQRMQMVKTKEQFEFALASVAEEVTAILKSLSQT